MTCNCKVCQYGREVQSNMSGLDEKKQEFFQDMYERLCMAEMDRDVNQAVIDGTWPSADQQIYYARVPLIPNNLHFLSFNTFNEIP